MIDLELTYIKNPDGSRTLAIPDDQRAAAIAFLRQRGTESAAQIEAMVEDGHGRLLNAVAGLSHAQATFKPAPDEWSALELMAHVVTAKQLVAALCAGLASGSLPPGFGESPQGESAQDGVTITRFETLDAACTAASAAHKTLLGFIRSADGPVNTDVTFRHFVFGALNCREWAAFQRLHDDNHAPQAHAIQTTPGFPSS